MARKIYVISIFMVLLAAFGTGFQCQEDTGNKPDPEVNNVIPPPPDFRDEYPEICAAHPEICTDDSRGCEVEVLPASSAATRPNIFLLFDSSGSMELPGEPDPDGPGGLKARTLMQIVKDLIAGTDIKPGIIDVFVDANYGLAKFDTTPSCLPGVNDFSPDSTGDCLGMDLIFNPTVWADFPAYPDTSSSEENFYLQLYIRDPLNLDPDGYTPIASALHQAYYYFYNADPGPAASDPGVYVDYNDDGVSEEHVIQCDPAYLDGKRKNILLFVVDGPQTDGEPVGYVDFTLSDEQVQNIMEYQCFWIWRLKGLGWPGGVKVVILSAGNEPGSIAQAEHMAACAEMPGGDPITSPIFLTGDHDTDLHNLNGVFHALMEQP